MGEALPGKRDPEGKALRDEMKSSLRLREAPGKIAPLLQLLSVISEG